MLTASAIGGALGFTGTTAVIVGGAVVLATTVALTASMMPEMPELDDGALGSNGAMVNTVTPSGFHEVVYGEVRKGGVITFQEVTNDNQFLHQIIILAGHEVESLGDIYLNGELAPLNSNGMVTGGQFSNKVHFYKHLGDQTTADSGLVSATSVDSNFKNLGLAYIYMKCEFDPDVFTTGVPVVTCVVKGKKVYNPSTDTTAWSDNAALCIRDYMTAEYGFDVPTANMDDTTFSAAYTACENSLGSGGANKMTCNGVLSCKHEYEKNIAKLLTSCQGILYWSQGYWKLKVGVYYTPSVTFTESNLRSQISVQTKSSSSQQFNKVQGQFADKDQNYILSDYPMISSSTFITEDGGAINESTMDLDLPLTTSPILAQRLAKLALFRAREQIIVSAEFDLTAMAVEIGDTINLTIERYGWSAKKFEVIGWTFTGNEKGSTINLSLKETSSAAYSWNNEETAIIANDTTLTQIRDGLTISNFTAVNSKSIQTDGTAIAEFSLAWTSATNAMVDFYEVEWKPSTDSGYAVARTTDNSFKISPVRNVQYNVRVRAVTVNGNKGAYTSTTVTGGGDTTAPAVATSINAIGSQGAITIEWTNPSDADLRYIDIYEASTNSSSSSTKIGSSSGSNFVRPNLGAEVTKYYWLKSVDMSGNQSGFSAGVNATTSEEIVSKGGGLYRAEFNSGDFITYTVTVISGQFYLDGVQSPAIQLLEGYKYKFDQSDASNSNHPLKFSTTSNGTHGGGSAYTTGVSSTGTAGSSGAFTTITVASSAPDLFYYCQNHSNMGDAATTPSTKTTGILTKVFQYAYGSVNVQPAQSDRLLINDADFLNEDVAYIFNGISWDSQTSFIDGNFLVTGTITGNKLSANSISGLGLTIGSLTDNSSGERITISDSKIQVFDNSNVLRVKIGDLT
jgi:hypothetical protein